VRFIITFCTISCLQDFTIKWWYDLTLWPLTLKNDRLLFLIIAIKSTKLYDPEVYCSVSILPTRFPAKWFVCLIVHSHEQFFSYPAAVIIIGDRAANLDLCLALMAYSSEGSFTCHTYCDMGPPFYTVGLVPIRTYHILIIRSLPCCSNCRPCRWPRLSDATTLKNKKLLPFFTVIKCTKLYDPEP
jgi:hypothetical protein